MQDRETHDLGTNGARMAHTTAQFSELIEGELVEGEPYSSSQLADELGVAESTIRTRWLSWLLKVAPVGLLKTEEGYTELARSLFIEFSQVPSKKASREQWVKDAKERYSREFMPSGLVGDGVPSELGSALAVVRHQGSTIQTAADTQLTELENLIMQQAQVEAEFDEADIAAMRAAGTKRGVMRFQIETEYEDATYYHLRQKRSQARSGNQGQSQDT